MLRAATKVVLTTCVAAAASNDASMAFEAPPPSWVRILSSQHHGHDWLRVTTDSTRLEIRARRLDEEGLHALTFRNGTRLPSAVVPWESIARIDVRESRFRHGQVMGVVFGGLLGAAIGGAAGAVHNRGDVGARQGLGIGIVLGGWLGARAGDAIVSERPWYAAAGGETPAPRVESP